MTMCHWRRAKPESTVTEEDLHQQRYYTNIDHTTNNRKESSLRFHALHVTTLVASFTQTCSTSQDTPQDPS